MSEEPRAPMQPDYASLYNSIVNKKPIKQGTDVGLGGEEYIVSLGEDKVFVLAPAAYYIWRPVKHRVRSNKFNLILAMK